MEGQKGQAINRKSKGWLIPLILLLLLCGVALAMAFLPGMSSWKQVFRMAGVSDLGDEAMDYGLSVHFLDVGKADAIYLHSGEVDILIDAGDVALSDQAAEYLKRRGVERLDLVVATHPDKDHIGGMAAVLNAFPVERFLTCDLPQSCVPDTDCYRAMQAALAEKEIPVQLAQPGDTLRLAGLSLEILGPARQYEDSNNNSVVLRLIFGADTFLFMGDAEKEAEADLLASGRDLRAQLLKVGHHGSKSSTTEALLQAVRPSYAVISVGEDSNDLPKKSVLRRLADFDTSIYRTDINGDVIAVSNGEGVTVFTERGSS